MNKKLLKSIVGTVLFALPFVSQAQIVIYPEANDATVSETVMNDTHNELFNGNRTIEHQTGGSCGIMPFMLPAIPEGGVVSSASLKIYVMNGTSHWIGGKMDLYGLPYRTTNEITLADYYAGDFMTTERNNTGIQEDLYHKNVAVGTADTDRFEETTSAGNIALAAYINAQISAGAVEGDFIYLRMSPNGALAAAGEPMAEGGFAPTAFWKVHASENTNPPALTITFDGEGEGGSGEDIVKTVLGDSNDIGVNGNVVNENPSYPAPELDVWLTRPVHYIGGLQQVENGVDASELAKYDGIGVIPFLLPNLPEGYSVKEVDFSSNLESASATWGELNCDLYALPARPASTVLVSDFFVGDFDTDASATGIQDNYIPNEATVGVINSDATGDANLKAFIQAQYDAGKAGEYVFLRVNPDVANIATYLRINLSSADHEDVAKKPTLKITFEADVASVGEVEKSALAIYPNPNKDGQLNVSLEGFTSSATLNIYAITGQLVQSETIKVLSRNIHSTELNLQTGIYIVKLQEGNVVKTQKLIIQ